MLTIITLVDQNLDGLRELYRGLKPFLSPHVKFIVKDSARCESTREWLSDLDDSNVSSIISPDEGIYQGLNAAIKVCSSEFYCVVGSDDFVFGNALLAAVRFVEDDYCESDFYVFPVISRGRIIKPRKYIPLSYSVSKLVTSHSVGTIIRTALHQDIGEYNESYKILSDSFFFRKAFQLGKTFRRCDAIVMGEFGFSGISSTQISLKIHEAFRYNVECGDPVFLQRIFLSVRWTIRLIRGFNWKFSSHF